MHKYKILKDVELIIQYYENSLTFLDVIKLKLNIINDSDFNPNFCFLIDVRNANYEFTKEEYEKLGIIILDHLKTNYSNKVAILTCTPNQVVSSMLIVLNEKFNPTNYKIFSTLEAAVRWLNIDMKKLNIFLSKIEYLKID